MKALNHFIDVFIGIILLILSIILVASGVNESPAEYIPSSNVREFGDERNNLDNDFKKEPLQSFNHDQFDKAFNNAKNNVDKAGMAIIIIVIITVCLIVVVTIGACIAVCCFIKMRKKRRAQIASNTTWMAKPVLEVAPTQQY